MTNCQISLAGKHLFLAFVFLIKNKISEVYVRSIKNFKCFLPSVLARPSRFSRA